MTVKFILAPEYSRSQLRLLQMRKLRPKEKDGDTAMCGHSQEDRPDLLSLVPGKPAPQGAPSWVCQTLEESIESHHVAKVRKCLPSFFFF